MVIMNKVGSKERGTSVGGDVSARTRVHGRDTSWYLGGQGQGQGQGHGARMTAKFGVDGSAHMSYETREMMSHTPRALLRRRRQGPASVVAIVARLSTSLQVDRGSVVNTGGRLRYAQEQRISDFGRMVTGAPSGSSK